MKRIIFTFILILKITIFVAQEQGFLTGKITDKETNEELSFVSIAINQNGHTITGKTSNIDGTYSFSLAHGTYEVEAAYLGYYNEKEKIEITSGDTTILNFQLTQMRYKLRYNIVTIYDTININAVELSNIDDKFKIAIDNHIKELRKKLFCVSKKRNIISVYLLDRLYSYYEKLDTADISLKHNNFKENKFEDGYNICINFIGKNNEAMHELGYNYNRKHFHYKYKNWDIFFITRIKDLEFPFAEGTKNYKFYTQYKDIKYDNNGKYEYKKIEMYWYKGFPYKKYEEFYTLYDISDFDVIFKVIKRKCLICPPVIM